VKIYFTFCAEELLCYLQAKEAAEQFIASQEPKATSPAREQEGIPVEPEIICEEPQQKVDFEEPDGEPEEPPATPKRLGRQEGPPAHNLPVEDDPELENLLLLLRLLLPANPPPMIVPRRVSSQQSITVANAIADAVPQETGSGKVKGTQQDVWQAKNDSTSTTWHRLLEYKFKLR